MSHYNVAVIMDGTKSLEDLLAPYDETTEDRKYSEFCDIEDEYREKYENEGDKKVKMLQDGSLVDIYDEQFLVEISEGMYNLYRQDENIRTTTRWNKGQQVFYRYDYGVNEVVDVPYKETYATFEEFMSEYGGYTRDEEKNRYGYWHNPNAKWDWWQVGGRWAGMLKDGRIGEQSLVYPKKVTPGFFDIAKIKDIDFTPDKDAYDRAIRFWEVVEEEQPTDVAYIEDEYSQSNIDETNLPYVEITPEKLNLEYVAQLIKEIEELEKNPDLYDASRILYLHTELDTILEILGQ